MLCRENAWPAGPGVQKSMPAASASAAANTMQSMQSGASTGARHPCALGGGSVRQQGLGSPEVCVLPHAATCHTCTSNHAVLDTSVCRFAALYAYLAVQAEPNHVYFHQTLRAMVAM